MVKKLAGSEKVGKEGVVIETPYSMRSCGFKEVESLYSTSEDEISR